MAKWTDNKRIRKAAGIFALIVCLDIGFMPSIADNAWPNIGSRERHEEAGFRYVLEIVREHRTGLGASEEFKLAQVIMGESMAYEFDPVLVLAIIKTESTFYNWSKSFNGAVGLMQIKPDTGKELAKQMELEWNGERTLLDPYLNVKMGVKYFSRLNRMFDNDTNAALAAYNVGPGTLASAISAGDGMPSRFAEKVLENYRNLKERAQKAK